MTHGGRGETACNTCASAYAAIKQAARGEVVKNVVTHIRDERAGNVRGRLTDEQQ
jgi:hypothetical protein